ncbi:hypothetical protein C0J50_15478 [Silurus asotus]|uniref:Uncharacterized protein n=1 Tax=Silurus asotus TaxID=30991 RepID=A0AAD5FRB2_SILAS|nr:hypothetical protein C0J50_15478 [Silurus asotus]
MELFRRFREFFQRRRQNQFAEKEQKLKHMQKVVTDLEAFNILMIEKSIKVQEENNFLVKMVQELEATLSSERKQWYQDINERNGTQLQSWGTEQKQLEECVAQLKFNLELATMKLQYSLKIHDELQKTVECERESWARERKKVEEHVAQLEATLEQTTMKLQSSLKINEELEKTVECESESWKREQKKLEEHVSQLEATLLNETKKWEDEREKTKRDMEERNTLHLQSTKKLQDSLNLCKEEKKRADHEIDNLMRLIVNSMKKSDFL